MRESDGGSEGGYGSPVGAGSGDRGRRRRILKTLIHLIRRSVESKPILARVRPTSANGSHGVHTREGITAIRQPPAPNSERTDVSWDSSARQRAPVGDSLNDEQWSNDLNLTENRDGQTPGCGVFGSHRSNGEQRARSEKSTRLDEHGGDSLVQSADSGSRPRGSANVPAVQDEPEDDHKGEGDV